MFCSICFNEIPSINGWDSGNNANPVNMGRCCNACDNNVVIPARINMMTRRIPNEQYMEMLREQFNVLQNMLTPVASAE